MKRVYITGLSSWVGYYVAEYLAREYPRVEVVGSYRVKPKYQVQAHRAYPIRTHGDSIRNIEKECPDVVIHLARGETEEDFQFHQELIDFLNLSKSHYGYASSFNAVDADLLAPHPETQQGNAASNYGRFKARCEAEMDRKSNSFFAFRFSATHGWAPNRIARTEEFLQRLQSGETVTMHRGVFQNCSFVGDLGGMIADIAINRGEGIFNLGSEQPMDGIEFRKRLAERFGYSRDQVQPGERHAMNGFLEPNRIYKMFGNKWRLNNLRTIDMVARQPEFQKYLMR